MPNYKLTYFNGRGRAEVARLIFAYADVPYEDVRIQGEEWAALKASGRAPFGQLPILEVDGKVGGQSLAIIIFLAREFGLHASGTDALMIDQVLCQFEDFRNCLLKCFFEKDETRKAELMKKLLEEDLARFMTPLNNMLKANSAGVYAGNKISLADIVAYDHFWGMINKMPEFKIDDYPAIKKNYETVANNEKIKKWVASRPQTEF